jgi:hypothetical protein
MILIMNQWVIYYNGDKFDLYDNEKGRLFNDNQVWELFNFVNNEFLITHKSGSVICNDQDNNARVELLNPDRKCQFWTIEEGIGTKSGYVRFKNSATGRALTSRVNGSQREIECNPIANYDDQWFILDQSSVIWS